MLGGSRCLLLTVAAFTPGTPTTSLSLWRVLKLLYNSSSLLCTTTVSTCVAGVGCMVLRQCGVLTVPSPGLCVSQGFIPEAVLITCTPPPSNTGQITDEFIYRIADTGGSLVFWFVRDFADLLYFSAFLVYYWGHHKGFTYVTKDRRSAPSNSQAPNRDVPVVSDTGYGSQAPGRNNHTKSSLLSPPKSSPGTRAPAKPRRSLSLCPHPRYGQPQYLCTALP